MKIAYLSTFYPFRGGIAQFNAALYRELEKIAQVKAFTFTRQYPDVLFPGATQFVEENDGSDRIPAERVLDTVNPLTYPSTAKAIMKFQPDILLMKYWMPFFAPSLGNVAKRMRKYGTKNIAIVDNVIPHEQRLGDETLTQYFLKRCDGFVVMSNSVKWDLLKYLPAAKYIHHQHPLYDQFGEKLPQKKARKTLNIDQKKKVALFFGFIREYKGLDVLLEAMSLLPDDYELIVAGEVYGDFAPYQKIIDERGLSSKVNLNVRYIADDEVPLFFSAADLCVLPYKNATQSGISGIAYHFDLPVAVTDVGSLKEVIEPNKLGMIIDKPEPAEIAEVIKKFFNKNKAGMYRRNIRKFKKIASWENFASSLVEFSKAL